MEKEQEKLIKAVNAELEEWLCSGDTDYLHKAMAVIRAEIVKRTYTTQYTGMIFVPAVAEKLKSGNNENYARRIK